MPSVSMATAIGTQRTVAGGTKVALIKASIAEPEDRDDLELEVQFSEADQEDWQLAAVATGAFKVDIIGLEDGKLYDVRFRWRSASGAAGPYALIENIPATADPTPPGPVTNLATDPGNTAGTVAISWTNPNSVNFKAVRIYRKNSSSFTGAVDILGPLYGAPGTGMVIEDTPPSAGTWYYWVISENGSGVQAARVGPSSEAV